MTASPNPTPPKVVWGSEARTAASLLLFVHLFAVVVAITVYTRPSVLQLRLYELFDPYVRNLHLTAFPVSYPFARYHLTHALPIDVDFTCQVQVQDADGNDRSVRSPLMDCSRRFASGGIKGWSMPRARWLTKKPTRTRPESFPRPLQPRFFGRTMPRKAPSACGPTICRRSRILLPAARRAASSVPGTADVYEAQVFMSDGRVDLLKKSTTLEVAPVESGPAETPSRPSPRQQRSPPPNRSE